MSQDLEAAMGPWVDFAMTNMMGVGGSGCHGWIGMEGAELAEMDVVRALAMSMVRIARTVWSEFVG